MADGGAFCFGGVGGEDWLDLDFFKGLDDLGFAESFFDEAVDDRGPEALDGGGSVRGAAGAAELPGDAFFDDVQELETDGKKLGPFAFRSSWDGGGEGFSFLPRDE